MDLLHHPLGRRIVKNISTRILPLSKFIEEKLRRAEAGIFRRAERLRARWLAPSRQLRLALGFFFLVMALVLACWAKSLAQSAAEDEWQRTHLPSYQVLAWAFESQGFKKVHDEARSDQVLRLLPVEDEGAGWIWLSEDLHWIAALVPSEASQDTGGLVFCSECREFPKNWLPAVRGWKGLEVTAEVLRKSKVRAAAPKAKFEGIAGYKGWQHPREFVY